MSEAVVWLTEGEAICCCQYLNTVFAISLVAVAVSTHLCHCCLWPFGLFYVAVCRPNAMLEFDPNRASIFRCLLYVGVLGDQSKTAA